jgi:hypothetical protein
LEIPLWHGARYLRQLYAFLEDTGITPDVFRPQSMTPEYHSERLYGPGNLRGCGLLPCLQSSLCTLDTHLQIAYCQSHLYIYLEYLQESGQTIRSTPRILGHERVKIDLALRDLKSLTKQESLASRNEMRRVHQR